MEEKGCMNCVYWNEVNKWCIEKNIPYDAWMEAICDCFEEADSD